MVKIEKDKSFWYRMGGCKPDYYFFDNHELSLWVWLNNIALDHMGKHELFYFDAHVDCAGVSREDKIINLLMNFDNTKEYDDYKKLKIGDGSFLGIALKLGIFKKVNFFSTASQWDPIFHNMEKYLGDEYGEVNFKYSEHNKVDKKTADQLGEKLKKSNSAIVDIDLDYFIHRHEMVSINVYADNIIEEYFKVLFLHRKNIKLITMSFSHSYCDIKNEGGWENAKHIYTKFCEIFKITPSKTILETK